jgi:hypothetical protein
MKRLFARHVRYTTVHIRTQIDVICFVVLCIQGSILTGNIDDIYCRKWNCDIGIQEQENNDKISKAAYRRLIVLKTATINSCFENKILEHDLVYNRIFLAQQKAPTQFYQ